MLERKKKYLQLAFNADIATVAKILPQIPFDERILIEAGTPFIKREGKKGIKYIADNWKGEVVADLKTLDGAIGEVELAHSAGATAATVCGSAPPETLNLFISKCKELEMDSIIDMIYVQNPLKVLMSLKEPPTVVELHKGRDEEATRGKIIQYQNIRKIRSKYDVMISAAGGIDIKEATSAIFNGVDIVVVNIVRPEDPWIGIKTTEEVKEMVKKFLELLK
ncbi:MAG: orotidine 5'-phosphate decarboxylase / HUMPS family protein [Candidatus Aenigmatarchaeota archaeon]|jgi:3-keto-L-gulonate-6-phosphate decarboxylase